MRLGNTYSLVQLRGFITSRMAKASFDKGTMTHAILLSVSVRQKV